MPKKIHTRQKRHKGQRGTHIRKEYLFHNRPAKKGDRTFNTEEQAHAWAKTNGLKQEEYSLIKVKNFKKFQIQRKNVRVSKVQL